MTKKNAVREQLGISQELLASYLGVTRTLLAMYETNERSLPTDALLRNAELVLAIQHHATEASPKLLQYQSKLTAIAKKEWQEKRKACEYDLLLAKRKLSILQQQYQQAITAINTTHYLLNQLSDDVKNKRTKIALEIIEGESLIEMNSCNELAQQKLQLQINTLQYEMQLIDATICYLIKRTKPLTSNC